MNSDFSSNGDLIIESFPYSNSITNSFLYIKKSMGGYYFMMKKKMNLLFK